MQLSALNPARDADKDCQGVSACRTLYATVLEMERKVSGAAAALFGLWEAVGESAYRLFRWNDFLSDKEGVREQFAEEILQIEN